MSESDGEQAARSVALEQAYVHEVYEQCAEKTAQSRHHWPRIYQFLEELEPGALVCDIGCGNGKYLSVNHSIFKVGVDRCKRFADIAREKENEVLICDNLALPFRDESFDAVLSIAVVHHFATTERRVHALKELARVLRIGGRLVISVWAMEQRHRKFESQDVLVPWPKAYCINTSSDESRSPGTPNAYGEHRNQSTQKYLSTSKRNSQRRGRSRGYWIDPILSPSPSTSSLSSPNETCYSFFRRALQKLAGGRRSGNRPWFLDTWQNGNGKHRRHCETDDETADVDELPIELRRLEDANVRINKQPDSLSIKSKSVGDILEIQRLDIVRSRSSIPGLCSTVTSESNLTERSKTSSLSGSKPRLVKQKSHFVDDVGLEIPENTANQLIEDLPDLQPSSSRYSKRGIVPKQCSLNEELMSVDRLEEKERLRRNIMKQASLNEEIICKGTAFESFKDSIYSANATKRFQLLKSGLTNKIKQSTTNIEKVSGMSIKNGFVRILQSWKSSENENPAEPDATGTDVSSTTKTSEKCQPVVVVKRETESIERRPSREDGSDSSKDSSLQSDTSVDSEDSIASVIYVPKQDVPSLIDVISAPSGYHLSTMSAPPSPRVKHPPDLNGPRLKLITISPLLKQFPATSKSLPPPSPPGLSPHTLNSLTTKPFFGGNFVANQQSETRNINLEKNAANVKSDTVVFDKIVTANRNKTVTEKTLGESTTSNDNPGGDKVGTTKNEIAVDKATPAPGLEPREEKSIAKKEAVTSVKTVNNTRCSSPSTKSTTLISLPSSTKVGTLEDYSKSLLGGRRPNLQAIRGYRSMTEPVDAEEPAITEETAPLISGSVNNQPDCGLQEKSGIDLINEDESRKARLNQIKELLKQKPGFATRTKTSFPLVRRASTAAASRLDTVTKVLPRLLSLELFNPETDDLDSDSSGVSSPESVGSVISVISDERYILKKDTAKTENNAPESTQNPGDGNVKTEVSASESAATSENVVEDSPAKVAEKNEEVTTDSSATRSLRLIEAAANVASSLENAVGKAIQLKASSETHLAKTIQRQSSMLEGRKPARGIFSSNTKHQSLDDSREVPPVETTWNEQCRRHLMDFTEKLGENLIHDIDQYCQKAKREFSRNNEGPETGETTLDEKKESSDPVEKRITNPAGSIGQVPVPAKTSRKYNELANTIAWLNKSNLENAEKPTSESFESDQWIGDGSQATEMSYENSINRSTSDDIMDFVMVSKNGEFMNEADVLPKEKVAQEKPYLKSGNSMESSDIGDSIENTISLSDGSQTESTGTTGRLCSGSTASLKSANVDSTRSTEKRRLQAQRRSASEEMPSRLESTKQSTECLLTTGSNGTLSGSSSQESLPSDRGGGAITYHQYYHVFREGELDQLINKYVENLHIISSYYDHASWCIVAEKVQVWTI